jgi:DNA-directed RNA polymerase specialized sigma24 family protein
VVLDPDSPELLVDHAVHGDVNAFARIVRLHHEAMTRVALVVTGDVRAAVAAVAQAWTTAWERLDRLGDPRRLGPWLDLLATDEALFLVRHARTRDLGPSGSNRAHGDAELGRILADLDPEDRALLAQHHLTGLDPAELARMPLHPVAGTRARLARLSALVAGPLPRGTEPESVDAVARARLRTYVDVPVFPVHADQAARRALAEASLERNRLASVAVCAIVGLLVAAMPYLVPLVYHH